MAEAPATDVPAPEAPASPEPMAEGDVPTPEPIVNETAPPRLDPFPEEFEDELDMPSGGGASDDLEIPLAEPTENAVLGIRKTHNVRWRCDCDGLALRLDILFAVVGEQGQFVGASVDFFSSDGTPIRSVHLPYANACGQVSVWTRLVRMDKDAKYMRTCLVIPYRAFPCPPETVSYDVEARVRLLRRSAPNTFRTLATGKTTFTVMKEDPDAPRGWRDFNDAHGAADLPCSERQRRFKSRTDPLEDAYNSPKRAKEMWKPFCPIPGA